MVRFPMRQPGISHLPTRSESISRPYQLTTNSWKYGRSIAPRILKTVLALVGAEIARIEGRMLDAEGLYEKAIRSAHANGFIHNEAVAYEVAARFYAARGFDKVADAYLREARYCYLRWGADGKVRQLDQLYPHLTDGDPTRGATSTIAAPAELLDLATVIKVSQAVSAEMDLDRLIETVDAGSH